jgi:hypothetical protein
MCSNPRKIYLPAVNVGQILQSFEHFSSVKMAKYDTYLEDC